MKLTCRRLRTKRRNIFACSKISSSMSTMLFAFIFLRAQSASTYDIFAERNVWLRSAVTYNLRSATVCDHMETSLKCKSTADRTCDFTPLSANIISRSTSNEKLVFSTLIKSFTMFCVPLPSYNFMVSIKDDFYCRYFALKDKR